MPRLEVPVQTPLRFERPPMSVLPSLRRPTSIVVRCEEREFGWLALGPSATGRERAPTVTTRVHADSDVEWNIAREATQRFLSALAFEFDARLVSRPSSGGSGERDLLHPAGAYVVDDSAGFHFAEAPSEVIIAPDPQLRLAMAVYREGRNASSPFYGFLAFWNVLETAFTGDDSSRDAFLRSQAPKSHYRLPAEGDVAARFREDSRNAVAHIVRNDPTNVSVDPDLPEDRTRLEGETRWLRDLARKAILERWPRPVALVGGP